jgi:hypothetical protein
MENVKTIATIAIFETVQGLTEIVANLSQPVAQKNIAAQTSYA